MDWIIDGSKGIELEFGKIFMYLFFGGSVGRLCMSVLHVSEGFLVDAVGCNIVCKYELIAIYKFLNGERPF